MFVLRINPDDVRSTVEHITGPAKDFGPLMTKLAADLERTVRRNFKEGGRPRWLVSRRVKDYGGQTLIREGLLLNSIKRTRTGYEAIVFTRSPYAAIHQFGGVIRPVHAKALTIPIDKRSMGKRARDFDRDRTFIMSEKTHPAKMAGKPPLIMLKPENPEDEVIALFVLLSKVTIQARDFMTPPPQDIEKYERRIRDYLTTEMN